MSGNLQFVDWTSGDGIGRLTLNRPPLNIMNIPMLREMERVLEEAGSDDTLRVLILAAKGKLFSAGVDVTDHTPDRVHEMIPLFDRVCAALATFPVPTLAAVHAAALGGGCEIAMCCDLVIASENASFGQPEIRLASFAPVAAVRLPALVGYRKAAEMLFTGDSIDAKDAAQIGLINRAVPSGEFESSVEQMAGKLGDLSAIALRMCKEALRVTTGRWASLADMERLYLEKLMSTEDAHEGLAAFLLKRAPEWKHK
ncbi:MAG: enoyl-CoA hydratase/isomerase family protein [Acidobacteriia bacterium]|nr:enoyl-CoA hydratase/isomerase family protein [Terriglobia bacterium]